MGGDSLRRSLQLREHFRDHAVVHQKVVRAHPALAEQESHHSVNETEIPGNVLAVASAVVVIQIALVLHALAEASLHLEKEMATPVSAQKDIQSLLKKEKEAVTVPLEKDHPIHFNPAQTGHHALERNPFRKEMKEPEVKDLTRKENQARSNHVRTGLQVSVRSHLQNAKAAVTKSHSEEVALSDHDQATRHDSKRNRLIAKRKVVIDPSKTETPVHSIHADHDLKDLRGLLRGR